MSAAEAPLALLRRVDIVVCVGTGGVGKTTIAASIALQAARTGSRALVLTIDPARRLADALGVESLSGEPCELPESHRSALGIEGEGRLFAMMLDMKGTFDALVVRFAADADTRERILANPIYQHVSDALAGSAEYAAMEKVYELAASGRFDLIVLDTPPSQHALDFLDAPRRLLEFLDSRLVKLLVHPAFSAGRFGIRLFHGTTERVLKLVERVSGLRFLEDISEFLLAFEGMSDGFKRRARHVHSMLLGPQTGFVLVAAPSAAAARGALGFLDHLERSRVPLAGVVINRVRLWPGDPAERERIEASLDPHWQADSFESDTKRLAQALDAAAGADRALDGDVAARAAVRAARQYAGLVRLDRRSTQALRERAAERGLFVRLIPELPRDVHDVNGLSEIASHLFAGGARDAD